MKTHPIQSTFQFKIFMATRKTKFPVEKPYLKVDRQSKSCSSSSSSRQADLSYSYSCVKAFQENQNIIAELAFIHNKAQYRGLSHEPALFSLSGDREKPICQPFYYCTHPENSELYVTNESSTVYRQEETHSEYEPQLLQQSYKVNRSVRGDIVQDFHSKCEPEYPDLQVLVQWLKHQFKSINYLWPFSRTNCNYITSLCKRNKKMKMEMLLNNLNEGTKTKLKQYLAQADLSMEEKFSLCNESVIEVDISPISENPERLQDFLIFLQSLESGTLAGNDSVEKSGLDATKVIGSHKEKQKDVFQKQEVEHSGLFKNNKLTENMFYKDVHTVSNTRQSNKLGLVGTDWNKENSFEKSFNPSKNGNSGSGANRNYTEKNISYNTFIDENEIGNYIFETGDVESKSNNRTPNKFIINKRKLHYDRKIPIENPEKLTRMNFTFPDPKVEVQNKTNSIHPINNANKQNDFCGHREFIDYISNNQVLSPESNISCKCMLHQSREDYIRYKNQCLFGKGDENNNRFMKYVMSNKEKCEANIIANEVRPACMNNGTVYMESVDNDPPSVTKLVCNDKVKGESGAKPRIIQGKPRKNKRNENKVLINNNNMQERGNYKHLENKTNAHNVLDKDFKHYIRNISLDDNNNFVEYGKIAVNDVEKLVCAVNLSENTIATDCLSNIAEKCNNNVNVSASNYKQDTFNACFECLDYSINSITTNNGGKASLKQSIPSTNSQEVITNTSSDLSGENSRMCSEISRQKMEVNNSYKVNKLNKFENESLDSENKSQYSYESYPSKYYEEHSNRTEPSYKNSSDSNKKNNPIKIKIPPHQIHVLVKNTNQVERDVLHLNQCLPPVNKVHDSRQQQIYSSNESHEQNKTNDLIRVNSGEKRSISESTQTRSNKKHLKLNSLKPRNIYRSISSIFKGNRTKYKQGSHNVSHKRSSVECYEPEAQKNSGDGREQVTGNQKDIQQCTTPESKPPFQLDDQLLITCLEKLYEQLARQENEIRSIKQVLDKHVK